MAGGELTTIGRQRSEPISGLVYLDATADPGDPSMSDPEFVAAMKKLPDAMRQSPVLDFSSFGAYQASQRRANLGRTHSHDRLGSGSRRSESTNGSTTSRAASRVLAWSTFRGRVTTCF